MNAPTRMTAKELTGYDRLHNARLNKGTAFTEAERSAFGLEGLLPPAVLSLELQVARRHDEIARLENDLLKYLVLSDLQSRNETLYYAVLMSDPATYMPIVYTPTVGEACQKFGHIFRQPRGIYLPISARGRVKELLSNWPNKDVRFIGFPGPMTKTATAMYAKFIIPTMFAEVAKGKNPRAAMEDAEKKLRAV